MKLRLSIKIFCLALLMNFGGMLIWIFGQNTLRLVLTVLSIILFYGAGMTALIHERTFEKLSLLGKSTLWLYIYFFSQALVMNLISDGIHNAYVPNFFWDSGFFAIGIGAFVLVNVTKVELKSIVAIYMIVFALDILLTYQVLGISAILESGDRRDAFRQVEDSYSSKNVVYSLHMILTQMSLLMFALCIDFIRERKWILMMIPFLLTSVYLGVYYQKRFVFAEYGLFFVVYILTPSLRETIKGVIAKAGLIVLVITIGIVAAANEKVQLAYFLIKTRFENGIKMGSGFERLAETDHFLTVYDTYYYIFGRGLTSFVPGTEGGNNLHLGMGNFILKGGYIILILFTVMMIISFIRGLWTLLATNHRFDMWISAYVLGACFTYLSFWGWFPNIIFLPLALLSYDISRNFKANKTNLW